MACLSADLSAGLSAGLSEAPEEDLAAQLAANLLGAWHGSSLSSFCPVPARLLVLLEVTTVTNI